jgi:succinate dehydrogenase/fumarate reductase flavoprotein subunit
MQGFLTFLDGLKQDEIPALSSPSQSMLYNKAWLEAMEIENMVTVLALSARAALERKESRGVHFREDYPMVDNENWLKEIVLQQVDGGTQISTRPINVTSMTPPTGVVPYMDYIKRMMQGHSDTGGHH